MAKHCYYCEGFLSESAVLEIKGKFWHSECRTQYLRVRSYRENAVVKAKDNRQRRNSEEPWIVTRYLQPVYQFILDYHRRYSDSPSYQEICQALNLPYHQKRIVAETITNLQRQGCLKRIKQKGKKTRVAKLA